MVIIALVAWGITRVEEKPRFSPPKVIATYEPHPWYPEPVIPNQLKELAKFERVTRITE